MSRSFLLVVIAVMGLLTYTNPSIDDYGDFIRQSIVQEVQKERLDGLGQIFSPLFGSIAGSLVASQTVRNDFIFFSLYEVELGKQRFKALGFLKRFLILEAPKGARPERSAHID